MTQHLVRYTVKADQVAHNEELVRAVFAELDQVQPPGLRYATFRLDDGVTFIHLVCHDKAKHGPLPHLPSLRAFHDGIRERCDTPPVRTELSEIGSFRLLSET